MVKVASSMIRSKQAFVDVEIKGIAEVQRNLLKKSKMIKAGTDSAIAQVANLLQQEIQESIIGNRAELKSVDTGTFANSITLNKLDDNAYQISAEGTYPNGVSVGKIATILEYGTRNITERRHFRNSLARNEKEMRDIIAQAVRDAVK